jgi:hypothetical protein
MAGDFNSDGAVDASDYVVWRKSDGTEEGYNAWRTHFGKTAGSGADASTNAAVPEPATLVILMFAASCCYSGGAGSRKMYRRTHQRVTLVNNDRVRIWGTHTKRGC